MRLDFEKAEVIVRSLYVGENFDKCTASVQFKFDIENGTPPYTWEPKFLMEKGNLSFYDAAPGNLTPTDQEIVIRRALKAICIKAANTFAITTFKGP